MTLVGCDLHARRQQVLSSTRRPEKYAKSSFRMTGTPWNDSMRPCRLPSPWRSRARDNALWFHAVIRRLGHTLLVGDASKIRAMVVRKTKNDRRDALHLLDLLRHERLPLIWVPDPETRDLRTLLAHRMRLVRFRTAVMNGLHAMALSHRLVTGSKRLTRSGSHSSHGSHFHHTPLGDATRVSSS
jgi:hypothetical protein